MARKKKEKSIVPEEDRVVEFGEAAVPPDTVRETALESLDGFREHLRDIQTERDDALNSDEI
jgi:hypothetical protein